MTNDHFLTINLLTLTQLPRGSTALLTYFASKILACSWICDNVWPPSEFEPNGYIHIACLHVIFWIFRNFLLPQLHIHNRILEWYILELLPTSKHLPISTKNLSRCATETPLAFKCWWKKYKLRRKHLENFTQRLSVLAFKVKETRCWMNAGATRYGWGLQLPVYQFLPLN